jgi:hypothetical protein
VGVNWLLVAGRLLLVVYWFRIKIVVIARRFLPKQSLDFQRIASLACGTAWRGGRQGRR